MGDYNTVPFPAQATLISPSGNIGVNNPPAFTWNAVTEAAKYKILIRDHTNGIALHNQLYTAAQVGCDVATPCSLAPFTTPLATGIYTWRVRTENLAGVAWSSTRYFSVGSAPATAATLDLSNG